MPNPVDIHLFMPKENYVLEGSCETRLFFTLFRDWGVGFLILGVADHFFDTLDPGIFEEFHCCGTVGRVSFKATEEEILTEIGDLFGRRQSWKVRCRDMVHDLMSANSSLRELPPIRCRDWPMVVDLLPFRGYSNRGTRYRGHHVDPYRIR
jgi:hypothetical protein